MLFGQTDRQVSRKGIDCENKHFLWEMSKESVRLAGIFQLLLSNSQIK